MLLKAWNEQPKSEIVPSITTPKTSNRSSWLPQATNIPFRTSPLKIFSSSTTSKPNSTVNTQKDWQAEFLNDLRCNRPARPLGSRPLPERDIALHPASEQGPPLRTTSAMSRPTKPGGANNPPTLDRCSSAISHRRMQSEMPIVDAGDTRGRPLIQQPNPSVSWRSPSRAAKTSMVTPSATYRESGQRWMEKKEARSLRQALEDMDLQDEERLHAAAQDEATELVWKHRNSNLPYKNPDAAYNFTLHHKTGSQARIQSTGSNPSTVPTVDTQRADDRSMLADSVLGKGGSIQSSDDPFTEHVKGKSDENPITTKHHAMPGQEEDSKNVIFPLSPSKFADRRRISGSKSRKASGGLFRNPDDQIYEEPEESRIDTAKFGNDPPSATLRAKTRNVSSVPRIDGSQDFPPRNGLVDGDQKLSRFEIHINPPSQSRNPSYLQNALPPTQSESKDAYDDDFRSDLPSKKDGMDIRSEEIRAATSMRRKDRSPKLPSPSIVSDQPGRPIVSFDPGWKPKEINLKRGADRAPDIRLSPPRSSEVTPATSVNPATSSSISSLTEGKEKPNNSLFSGPPPTISISSDIPGTSIQDISSTQRPLPTPTTKNRSKPIKRPLPDPSYGATADTHHPRWSKTPNLTRATAQCYACALPISGRIVSAASQRFHPNCFTCHHCSTLLEHVAFYPEPDDFRIARLARISARADDAEYPEEIEGKTAEEDGDDALRFYCHLDFHEEFSPRCRSCKTPIEGEVVLACGGSWHVGHFFCAECGDPFDAKTPFVEKGGYAWCVECHTKKFSGKCKGCRRPIVDLVVRALGGEWHDECFGCKV